MFYENNLTLMCGPTLQLVDWRSEFTKWWVNEFKAVKFPSAGHVFNYYIDPETKRFMPWTEKVVKFELDSEIPLQVNQKMHLGEAHAMPTSPQLNLRTQSPFPFSRPLLIPLRIYSSHRLHYAFLLQMHSIL